MLSLAYIQPLTPAGGVAGSTLIALVPGAVLLIFLAGIRLSAWLAVILGSAQTRDSAPTDSALAVAVGLARFDGHPPSGCEPQVHHELAAPASCPAGGAGSPG